MSRCDPGLPIEFFLAVESDLRQIIDVRRSAILGDAPSAFSQVEVTDWADKNMEQKLKQQIGSSCLWVAKTPSSEICAWGSLRDQKVEGLYVKSEYQRKGIGRRTLNFLESKIREMEYKNIILCASLNAIEFYQKCGYSNTANNKHEKMQEMSKDI